MYRPLVVQSNGSRSGGVYLNYMHVLTESDDRPFSQKREFRVYVRPVTRDGVVAGVQELKPFLMSYIVSETPGRFSRGLRAKALAICTR